LIGSAQGEVMSGDLLNYLTDPIRVLSSNCLCVKFADDFFIAAWMRVDKDFKAYQNSINHVTGQMENLDFRLNDDKKKEIIFDFTANQRITSALPTTLVLNEPVERVTTMRMLGYHFNENFTSADHVSFLLKKVKPRLFLLYKMVSMQFPKNVLIPFYSGAIRSPLEFATPAFHYSLSVSESKSIERLQKRSLKSLNRNESIAREDALCLPSLSTRREESCTLFFEKLLSQSSPLIPRVKPMRKGHMLDHSMSRTKRYENTLIPSQINSYNNRNIKNPETQKAHACYQKH
jgi:hypothetical protein